MSVDSADAPPPPPPPPPPPDYSIADQPVIDIHDDQAAPDDTASQGMRADTVAANGSAALQGVADDLAPADVPMVDDGQAIPKQASGEAADGVKIDKNVPTEAVKIDGRDAIVIGNWRQCAENAIGSQGSVPGKEDDCGIVACANVANEFGKDVSEAQAVQCAIDNKVDIGPTGGTSPEDREQTLSGLGIKSTQVEVNTLNDIARPIENGQGEIVMVNAGQLWDDSRAWQDGIYNHAIQVTGVARDTETGQILGFRVNDSGLPNDAGTGQFVPADRMEAAAFPKDDNGNPAGGQNYANVTIDKWMNIEKKEQ